MTLLGPLTEKGQYAATRESFHPSRESESNRAAVFAAQFSLSHASFLLDDFPVRWTAHNVGFHRTGAKRIHHPDFGDLGFAFEAMELPEHPGWGMLAFATGAGSPSDERDSILARLVPTGDHRTQETSDEL